MSEPQPASARPLLSIQYLRAFAALAVVGFHACQWADINFDVGAAGVDVFFVISGFLMWRITEDPAITPTGFLLRRIGRVAPLYWIITLALAGLALAAPRLIWQLKPQPWHLVLSLFFLPHLDPDGIPFPFLPPGWTLNYEAILYLIFTASLFVPRGWRLRFVLGTLCVIPVVGVLVIHLFPLFANPMMFEFAAGVWLSRMFQRIQPPSLGLAWSLIGLGLVSLAMLRLLNIHSDIGRWFIWGAPALIIVIGALGIEANGGLPWSRTLRRLGDASYSIYLCHWPVIALAARVGGISGSWPFVILSSLTAVAAGWLMHAAVERPLLRWMQRRPVVSALSAP